MTMTAASLAQPIAREVACSAADVSAVTQATFFELAGLDVYAGDVAAPRVDFTAMVRISGAWEGSVLIGIGQRLAKRLAADMFVCDRPGPEDSADAVAELTHVLAWNLSALFPGTSTVSPAAVGFALEITDPSAPTIPADACRLSFACEGESFSVAVVERA